MRVLCPVCGESFMIDYIYWPWIVQAKEGALWACSEKCVKKGSQKDV